MANRSSSKRPCLQDGIHAKPVSSSSPNINYISRLPLEMLAEILSHTTPPDILSLARASRYFCVTLVTNPSSLFIWKAARARFYPKAIPDPTPNWTESAYIAFIFDKVPCEVCEKPTRRSPFSYALRGRLCDSRKCHKTWLLSLKRISPDPAASQTDLAHVAAVQSWLPCFEASIGGSTDSCANTLIAIFFDPGDNILIIVYRPSEWEAAIQQHRDSVLNSELYSQIQQVYARKALLKPGIMQCAKALRIWGRAVERWRRNVRLSNKNFLESKAPDEGWLLQDFVNTPFYLVFRKMKDAISEKITERDFKLLKDEAAEQVAQCRTARIRRAVEDTGRVNREDLRYHWNMLKSGGISHLPPYSEFLHFDMARTLAKKNTDVSIVFDLIKESVREELQSNKATCQHLREQISAWMQDTEAKFSEMLGYNHLALVKEAGFVQPVDRVTAWFSCRRCSGVGHDKPLTFEDVCSHRCLARITKVKPKAWDAGYFEPNHQVIAAVKQLLRVCSLEERHTTKMQLEALGCRLLCKTCKDPIVMSFHSLIGHCKRHETITLELLTPEQALDISRTPLQVGLAAKLMGFSKSSNKQRHQRVFGCRHCQNDSLFTFDGLRSHVKSKHGIIDVGDEDFFQKAPDSNS